MFHFSTVILQNMKSDALETTRAKEEELLKMRTILLHNHGIMVNSESVQYMYNINNDTTTTNKIYKM